MLRRPWLFTLFVFILNPLAHGELIVEDLALFDPSAGDLPESVTVDHQGNIYLSFAGSASVARLNRDGVIETRFALPVPAGALALGVKVGPDNCLYALSAAFTSEPAAAFLWRSCDDQTVEQVAAFDPHGFPNDLIFDREGNIYVSDPALGRIWKVQNGSPQTWLEHPSLLGNTEAPALPGGPFGVDGLVLDRNGKALIVGNLDYGELLRIDIKANGNPGAIGVIANDERLIGIDGLALDVRGTLYAAINGQDSLVTITACGQITVLASGSPLDAPSSLVFRHARSGPELLISSFAINRAITGQVARPALQRIPTKVPGLPL